MSRTVRRSGGEYGLQLCACCLVLVPSHARRPFAPALLAVVVLRLLRLLQHFFVAAEARVGAFPEDIAVGLHARPATSAGPPLRPLGLHGGGRRLPTIGGARGGLHWGQAGQGSGGHHFLWGDVGRGCGAVGGGLAGREARGALAARKSRRNISRGPIAAPPKAPKRKRAAFLCPRGCRKSSKPMVDRSTVMKVIP